MSYLGDLCQKHRSSGVLIDANLLLLYLCGRQFSSTLANLKFLRKYTADDVALLERIVGFFPVIVTTPNILTEASNIAGRDLRADVRRVFRVEMCKALEIWEERCVESRRACNHRAFQKFGLTDAVVARLAETGCLVLSDDYVLTGFLQSEGLDALNLNHFREWT